ncbi:MULTISPECIES: universal stress protein [Edwardsiella]|uniref:Universal stress protein n=2 Tax=Edwardsiella anguillarum TaxID=1821960 RepID=A0A076LIV5_9GAMM|nr:MULTISPECIES: universal stress protein [Edwardsiella]AIJ06822.1 Universal stress protein A [Edwardsiella anguillarum ET080813]AKR78280.1 universal stress protein [Edwardsiella sp. LADL05-105]KAB0593417.1 universal stress protein UspA [Edwardsiella anguillarum]MDA6077240.1 universal stress protein [Edwardsiella anguillarum]UOU77987.1 universal stress protein [Edwardsiella anguillarum]
MKIYHHVLVLIHGRHDGERLLPHACQVARQNDARLTLGHIRGDLAALRGMLDVNLTRMEQQSLNDARQVLMSLVHQQDYPIDAEQIVSMDALDDLREFVSAQQVDLLMLGHHNRALAKFVSTSFDFINGLETDVLVKHL